ncbi:MAG TPA: hypothetical protein PKI89_10795 [Tepidiformaceae bacterium]|nr:hypothetical protein [Tepidiformaceae bacterium]
MFLAHTAFLSHHVYGGHPFAALFLYLLAAAVCVGILVAVANARGRSALWSLMGLWLIPGLLIGLLILIALPANTQPPTQSAA